MIVSELCATVYVNPKYLHSHGWWHRLDGRVLESCRGLPFKFCLGPGNTDTTGQPDDLVKQSLPFSYLSLIAQSNDGASHSVQLYTDISAEWVTGDNGLVANWSTSTGDIVTHQVQLQDQTNYREVSDHIQRMIPLH